LTARSWKGVRIATFSSLAIIVPAGGCDRARSTPERATAATYEALHTLIGNQVTIRGKFSLYGKFGAFVSFGNERVVYLVPRGSFTWGKPYTEMDGKLVEATGSLRFYHAPAPETGDQAVAIPADYFYLEAETAQLRLITR
jgi:hypothetical protein